MKLDNYLANKKGVSRNNDIDLVVYETGTSNVSMRDFVNRFKSYGYNEKKKRRNGEKLIDTIKVTYWLSQTLPNGQTILIPINGIRAYTYTYPVYKNSYVYDVVTKKRDKLGFYDDSVDEKLGGERQMLGV